MNERNKPRYKKKGFTSELIYLHVVGQVQTNWTRGHLKPGTQARGLWLGGEATLGGGMGETSLPSRRP